MDDLSSTIGSILGDPQKMEQLRAVAQSLGLGPPPGDAGQNSAPQQPQAPPPQQPQQQGQGGGFDPAALASMIQGLQGIMGGGQAQPGAAQPPPQAPPAQSAGQDGGGLGSTLGRLGGIFSAFNQNQGDSNVELLRALRPHISTQRAGRIDDAIRIMQLMRAWPALRDSGLLGSLGNLFGGGSR